MAFSPSQTYILGIDTSCDETSFAILDPQSGVVKANLISSQVRFHAEHGGVVPELASRKHSENLAPLFAETLVQAGITLEDIGMVAVTNIPGLMGCLLVGTSFAKALAYRLHVPLVAVNHLEAHLFSPFIETQPIFPFLGLVVSGGHTAFYRVNSFTDIQLLGQTVDDAAGEAFDKTAKLMGLGYPGGPQVDRLARQGDASTYAFTIPKVKMGAQYLSFSGMKTALYQHVQSALPLDEMKIKNLCASLENSVVETLMQKADYFLQQGDYHCFAVSGGVAMNTLLRKRIADRNGRTDLQCVVTQPQYCTDNAAMVAYLAPHRVPEDNVFDLNTTPSQKVQARFL